MKASLPPAWNAEGLLPPINTADPTSRDRSPYSCKLIDLIERFGTSPKRINILQGFMEYRKFLHDLNVREGFHWVNGSFTEDKERLKGSAPKDIDVVTYFRPPPTLTQSSLSAEQMGLMFQPTKTKERFRVDGAIMPFGEESTLEFIEENLYWSGLFSHTRTGQWKGFLRVDLNPTEDLEAQNYLDKLKKEASQ